MAFIWDQLGADIDGVNEFDYDGWRICLSDSGTTLAISSTQNTDGLTNGIAGGRVRIFDELGGVWVQRGASLYGATNYARFGGALSLSSDGNFVAVTQWNLGAANPGATSVYEWTGSAWAMIGNLINHTTQTGQGPIKLAQIPASGSNNKGLRLCISKPVFATSYIIYDWDSATSDWAVFAEAPYDYNDKPVLLDMSADGTRVIEHVRVTRSIRWTTFTNYTDANSAVTITKSDNLFGYASYNNMIDGVSGALSADGEKFVIGDPYNSDNYYNGGRACMYNITNTTWQLLGTIEEGVEAFSYAGYNVAISADGTTVTVNNYIRPRNDVAQPRAGQNRTYLVYGSTIAQKGATIEGEARYDNSGEDGLALNADGSRVAISAPLNDAGGLEALPDPEGDNEGWDGSAYGHTRIFQYQAEVIPNPNDADGDGYDDAIDAFPNDPTEWADSDGDGIGDNADPFPNGEETKGSEICVDGGYSHKKDGSLYLVDNGFIYKFQADTASNVLTWRSKEYRTPKPVSMAWFSISAEAYPVSIKIFADKALVLQCEIDKVGAGYTLQTTIPENISGGLLSEPLIRTPAVYAQSWEVEVSSEFAINEFCLAESIEEVRGT